MNNINNYNDENLIDEEIQEEERGGRRSSFSVKRRVFVVIIVVGILALIIAFVYGILSRNKGFSDYDTVATVAKSDNLSVGYYTTSSGLIRYSKDGASFTKNLEDTIWNQSFEMQSAKVVSCAEYLAIGDIGSNTIRILNEGGQVGSISTLSPIRDLDVAGQGVVYAVIQEGSTYYINSYDSKGNVLASIKASLDKTGYPLQISVSDDGTKLAVSYLKTSEGKVSTDLVFYNFGAAGQGEIDNIVGRYSYDEIFGSVKFIDNDTVACYGESRILILSMRSRPEIVAEIELTGEIRSIFASSEYVGVILAGGEDNEAYTMQVYTTGGKLHSETAFSYEYEEVAASSTNVIFHNGNSCLIYDYNGSVRFDYEFDEPIDNILPTADNDDYIVIFSDRVEEIKLK